VISALIIDDEESAVNVVAFLLNKYVNEIEQVFTAVGAEEGLKALYQHKPQLVFLDVEMPLMNGFQLLEKFRDHSFEVIFITAYDHYAIRAIKFSALDYLVKPIEVEDLKTAIEMVKQKRKQSTTNERLETLLHNLMNEKNQANRIAIPSIEGLQFVEVNDIIYLEAESNYTVVYIKPSQKITVSKTLKDFEELLPPNIFIRIHHSWIINKNHVQKYLRGEGGQVIMSNGKTLDVARRKKDEFMKAIGY